MGRTASGRKTAKRGTKRRVAKATSKSAMWPWYMAGVLIVAGMTGYDHLPMLRGLLRSDGSRVAANVISEKPRTEAHTAAIPTHDKRPAGDVTTKRQDAEDLPLRLVPPTAIPVHTAALRTVAAGPFYFCTDQKNDCIIDGGSFWFKGQKIGLADIAPPQMKKAKCDAERELGSRAKRRLRDILNTGDFKLVAVDGQGEAGDGRLTHVVLRDGTSVSSVLISEGLAHSRKDASKPWC
ncbi:endonuclease YncB(thermonuclease family) [Pararhizobium capsulatum DSM 1112]|uniref:Endonuclease YncB(Thermonuclease family) n=1 Tax=Pararhizobium capsulatum DSM 1112 TaxID=1121113 RepID=A0ABU0BNN1_9HYPH|nr:hypothetical protein [Pararhizobium capsulatum]MDQ0319858.1 endonuclease YncB(thermonuclease family) [Pararhizobium capsulatum DSM 1112]